MFRDRTSIIVAAMSAVMWLGLCVLFGGLGPLTWIGALVLLFGGIAAHVGRDDPAGAEAPGVTAPDDEDAPGTRGRRRGSGRGGSSADPGRDSIYGPPE